MSRPPKPASWLPLFLLCAAALTVIVRPDPEPPTAAPGPGALGTFGKRRAVVFGIDGCRSDALKLAVENGSAPNMKALIDSGAVTWNAFTGGRLGTPTQQTTNSGPGWSTVLTGVWRDKHGVNDNTFNGRNFVDYPAFFRRLHDAHPTSELSSLVSWPEINDFILEDSGGAAICACHTYSSGSYDQRDAQLVAKTIELIETGNPDVIFCYQGNVDIMGHTHGFHPTVPQYMAAIALTDQRIGQVLEAIRARPDYEDEDWLYIVTTDHGGKGFGHGGQSDEERVIPFIASGGSVSQGRITRQVVPQAAVPATVFRHLGLGIPANWGWESDAFQIGAELRASTGARSVFLSWSLPPAGIAGLTGFEVRRNGDLIATYGPEETNHADTEPGPGGQTHAYTVTLLGSDEAPLAATAAAPFVEAAGAPPDLHLDFDGDLDDASGRGNHATAEGVAVFAPGKTGQSLQLDGSSSARLGSVAAGAPDDLKFGAATDFTVSCWIKAPTPWSSDPGIISNKNWDSGANQGWILAAEANGNDWQWNFKGAAQGRKDFDPSAANIAGDTWRHLAAVHDRDGFAVFYHDGVEIGRVTIAGAGDVDTAFPVRIGRDGNNRYAWSAPAFIDDLKVWRRALTPAEVAAEAGPSDPAARFAAWMTDQAELHHAAGEALGAAEDPDGDGCANLLEYASGTSPFRAAERPDFAVERTSGGLRIAFSQRDGGSGIHGADEYYRAAGLRYRLERSVTLDGGWESTAGMAVQADAVAQAGPASSGVHRIAVEIPAAGQADFFRLRVELDGP
jgi:hypothetical protein